MSFLRTPAASARLLSRCNPRTLLSTCQLCHSPSNASAFLPRTLATEAAAAAASTSWQPHSAMNLTQSAMDRLQGLREKENNPRLALRVTVESGGCHGYQYQMKIEDMPEQAGKRIEASEEQQEDDDAEFDEPDELIAPPPNAPPGALPYLVTDPISLKMTRGATIDFATELIGSTFRIESNPQAKGGGCGCGVSWELKDDIEL